jgi:hypothetical protein
MRDPLLKPITPLSDLIPACNEQHLVTPSLDRLRVLGECSFLGRLKVIVMDEPANSLQLEFALGEAAI